ncbi:MAG: hypothetical protein IT166_16940 [Bryobacterales bacterium]|nr:hypothetical protein [Bryobacterales bacterium]
MGATLTATSHLNRTKVETGIRGVLWFLYPLCVFLIYKQALHVISFTAANEGGVLVVLAMAAAIGLPLTGLAIMQRSLPAAFAGYLTIVIPPLITATGGLLRAGEHGGYWTALAVSVPAVVFGGGAALSLSPGKALVKAHRATALALGIFVLAHLTNHLFALHSLAAHKAVQDALRVVYRNPVIEPLLIAALIAQALSGVALVWRNRYRQGFLNHVQAASGLFITVFLCSHVTAALVNGRALSHTETDFLFASGGPAGLLHSRGAVTLIPYYFLASVAFFTHVGGAMRRNLLRKRSPLANRVNAGVFALGVVVSVLILAALCGVGGLSRGV